MVWPESKERRCWNHKIRNVLDRLPKREQVTGQDLLRTIVSTPSRQEAVAARQAFEKRFEPWYPKAVETLGRRSTVNRTRRDGRWLNQAIFS